MSTISNASEPAGGEPLPLESDSAEDKREGDLASQLPTDDLNRNIGGDKGAHRALKLRRSVRTNSYRSVVVHGDFVTGDKSSTTSGEPVVRTLVSGLKALGRPPFVESRGYELLVAAVEAHHVVICECEPGVGGLTTVVQVLSTRYEQIAEIDPSFSLREIDPSRLPKKVGLVLDCRSGGVSEDKDFHRRRLNDAFAKVGSALIVVESPQLRRGTDDSIVRMIAAPSGRDILNSWLRFHGLDAIEDGSVADADIAGLSPSEASILASWLRDGQQLTDALAMAVAGRSDALGIAIGARLADATPEDGALFVAALVLGGLPEAIIQREADSLARAIRSLFPGAPERQGPFARSLSARLAALGLERTVSREMGLSDGATSPTLKIMDESLTEATLLYVWREVGLIEPLVSWLDELAASSDRSIRIAAATASAQLLFADTTTVGNQLIRGWARSPSVERRLCAAFALGIASALGGTDAWVLREIRDLSRSKDSIERWTAAVCLQTGFGDRFPGSGLDLLDRLLNDSDPHVVVQAILSLAAMFDQSARSSGRDFAVMSETVKKWMGKAAKSSRQEAVALAIKVFVDEVDPAVLDGPSGAMRELPVLLSDLFEKRPTRDVARSILVHILTVAPESSRSALTDLVRQLKDVSERADGRLHLLIRNLANARDKKLALNASQVLEQLWRH
jgi:hypothetical protein